MIASFRRILGTASLIRRTMLLLMPMVANAGVIYEVAVRPLDERNTATAPSAVVTQYFAEHGKVRVRGANAKVEFLFEDGVMYVIDTPSRTVHVLKHAMLAQVLAHYLDTVKQLEQAAVDAPPDERTAAQQKAADMRSLSDSLHEAVPREFRTTSRFESVDGRACRIWEEREGGAKRLELCVAAAATIPGGAEILEGMKTLSRFRQGSDFALGVEFGLSDWWPDIAGLGGLPLLIREYKYDSVVSEVMLTAMRVAVAGAARWDLPEGYAIQEGPEYALWYMR